MRAIRPTPITATRSGGDALPGPEAGTGLTALSGISVLSQRHDVFPAPALHRAQQCGLHAHDLDGVLEPRRERTVLGHRAAELVVLDGDQILEPDRVRVAGDEAAVIREAVAAEHRRVARAGIGRRAIQLQLVEPLEVPTGRATRAVHVERQLTLRADDRPAGLECPAGA